MPPETMYARTADGTHVAYQVTGEGPVDLLVMRAWFSHLEHEWEEPVLAGVLRRLGSIGRVIRLDRRGTGLSDRIDPAALPTLEDRIDDIRAVLDAARADRVVLVGMAHGGALCAYLAASYPERSLGLVLWSPPPSMLGIANSAAYDARRDTLPYGWGNVESARAAIAFVGPSRVDDPALVGWLVDEQQLTGTREEAEAQWELVTQTSVAGVLPTIHVPALVMGRAVPWVVAHQVAELLPRATLLEFPGPDHMFTSGDWKAPLVEIERFVDSLAHADPERDRVLATVMFTDIVGSTDHAVQLGDRSWAGLLEEHHAIARRALARHRGREIDTAGDGLFAAFDGPARAIRCALDIRDAVGELGISVRVGLHSGECERFDGGLRGIAVHVGARIGASASAGEVLVSRTVKDLVAGSGIAFEDAGVRQLKGVPEEWQVYRVLGATSEVDRRAESV
jgi:class 3 adenylate cyclase